MKKMMVCVLAMFVLGFQGYAFAADKVIIKAVGTWGGLTNYTKHGRSVF